MIPQKGLFGKKYLSDNFILSLVNDYIIELTLEIEKFALGCNNILKTYVQKYPQEKTTTIAGNKEIWDALDREFESLKTFLSSQDIVVTLSDLSEWSPYMAGVVNDTIKKEPFIYYFHTYDSIQKLSAKFLGFADYLRKNWTFRD
jgi:hypothetical protein